MKTRNISIATAVAALCLGASLTAVAQSDGERLPWGALKAGNKEGTIPPYTGGLPDSTKPPGYKKDSGFWPDPYADDKPLFTITGANAAQYADKLSEASKELLKRFPTYKMVVYPTRRSAAYPDWINENSRKNGEGRCKTIEGGLGVAGCFGGVPFPNPKTGHEVMWNAQLHYKGASTWTYGQGWYVDASGAKVMTAEVNNRNENNYYNKNWTPEIFYEKGGPYFLNNNIYTAPARNVGEGNLQRKYTNPLANPDKTWNYQPGQRRVRLSPDAGYDFPIATSGGASMYDEIYMFSGKMDRFDWKLIGVKEMYIPYNGYRWFNAKPEEVLQKNHPNPDVFRWELHRVYVVEATLKPGQRHVVPKKRYYYDEDAPGTGMIDGWDASGKLSRGIFAPFMQIYDKKIPFGSTTWTYEFNTGVYYHSSMGGGYKGMFFETDTMDESFYTPEGLARRTQR
jgi:hypothetical protein